MRDNRLTILMTPEERAAVDKFAENMGVSSSEFMRGLVEEFEQMTPEEQVELEQLLGQVNEVLPKMNASLERMSATLERTSATVREMTEQVSAMADRVTRIEETLVNEGLGFGQLALPDNKTELREPQ